ncbi:MAG: hypothetical protein IJ088_15800 [Clostridia bacterium]|nr:hypothetical protein [Clostridia bacterium]
MLGVLKDANVELDAALLEDVTGSRQIEVHAAGWTNLPNCSTIHVHWDW